MMPTEDDTYQALLDRAAAPDTRKLSDRREEPAPPHHHEETIDELEFKRLVEMFIHTGRTSSTKLQRKSVE